MIVHLFLPLAVLIGLVSANNINLHSEKPIVILNAFDKVGLDGALWFIESLGMFAKECVSKVYIFHPTDLSTHDSTKNQLNSIVFELLPYAGVIPTEENRIGKVSQHTEHVSETLYSWKHVMELTKGSAVQNENQAVLSLSFARGAIPVATPNFMKIFEALVMPTSGTTKIHDLILLGKTKKLTSISDWHDLSLVLFNAKSAVFREWLEIFERTYVKYSRSRTYFGMIEPRPAMLEASMQLRPRLSVSYFKASQSCSSVHAFESTYSSEGQDRIRAYGRRHVISCNRDISFQLNVTTPSSRQDHGSHPFTESRCHHLSLNQIDNLATVPIVGVEFYCGWAEAQESDNTFDAQCTILEPPSLWKKSAHKSIADHMFGKSWGLTSNDELMAKLNAITWYFGVDRLRLAEDEHNLHKYCFEDEKSSIDTLVSAKIEYDLVRNDTFTHPDYHHFSSYPSNISAVLMVASSANADNLENRLYMSLSKMYYTKRHGYKFVQVTSSEYEHYYPTDLFKSIPSIDVLFDHAYFRGIMTKPLMMLDMLYLHPDKEWLVFTDDDVYINPGFTYMPLDVFLQDVPANKVIVMANYRSTFTNVMMIRNNAQGRAAMMDWVGISMSGYIQCHGFDQAALATLIANRIAKQHDFSTNNPLNLTCYFEPEGKTGCNHQGDWSCDFKFERALFRAGFKTRFTPQFHEHKISSYTVGCANDYIDDFYVIQETKRRPRLQCGHCTRLQDIEASGHADGPLGGGNVRLIPGTLTSWFFNHKSEMLFHESYLKNSACKYIGEFVPKCNAIYDEDPLEDEEEEEARSKQRSIVPLVDGFAYDYDAKIFCKLTNRKLLSKQREKTYMKDYSLFIAAYKNISDVDWEDIYRRTGGGEGRLSCDAEPNLCYYGRHENGQKKMRPTSQEHAPVDIKYMHAEFFERPGFCEKCRPSNSSFPQLTSLECRSENDIKFERRHKWNLD